jgi:bacillithiol biosynthesis cysteine-adding enzyme BshC
LENPNRDLKTDYLTGAPSLRGFYRHSFFPVPSYEEVVKERSAHGVDRELLVSALKRQNHFLPDRDRVWSNIESLSQNHVFTVTTGHQLGLLGGPLYTVYKIATTIRLAEKIQASCPGIKVVPVFWMASEDHDLAEANHCFLDADSKYVYPAKFLGPVGRHVFQKEIEQTLGVKVPDSIRQFYLEGRTWAEAHRRLLHHLFGHHGLVLVDPDDESLKSAFLPWMIRELEGNGLAGPVEETNSILLTQGYNPVAQHRAVNLFFMGHGGRSGFVAKDGRISVPDAGIDLSMAEVGDFAKINPTHLSPNVLMRPLFQEAVLPNLAYVGGWAEIGYWMQLKTAFEHAKLPFPLLVPRMHGTLLTPDTQEGIQSLGLSPEDFKKPLGQLQDEFLRRFWDEKPVLDAMEGVRDSYARLAGLLQDLDPTLAVSAQSESAKAEGHLENLLKKLKKSMRNRHPKQFTLLLRIKGLLFPEREIQERLLNITAFGPDYASLIDQILAHCDPEKPMNQWIPLS